MRLARYSMGTRASLATIVLALLGVDGRVNRRLTEVPAKERPKLPGNANPGTASFNVLAGGPGGLVVPRFPRMCRYWCPKTFQKTVSIFIYFH